MNLFEFDRSFFPSKKENFFLAGSDEVGRGALAGPVVSSVVVFNKKFYFDENFLQELSDVYDSKKISSAKRKILKEKIEDNASFFSVSFVDEKIIDDINILNATKLSIKNNISYIVKNFKISPNLLLIDGNFSVGTGVPEISIVKGDMKSLVIACASILAKVYRDDFMKKKDLEYPNYHFKKHFGYATKLHLEMLKKFGPCLIHRKTFYPVSTFFSKQYKFRFNLEI